MDNLLRMLEDIQFRRTSKTFQDQLQKDIKMVRTSEKLFVQADKTRNIYEVDKTKYAKLLQENVSTKVQKYKSTKVQKYKSTKAHQTSFIIYDDVNRKAKLPAEKLDVADRVQTLAKSEAYLTSKNRKTHFENTLPCRLINPAKSEIGRIT